MKRQSLPLGKSGKGFRKKVLSEVEFENEHDFRRLDLACHCLDRIAKCHEEIESEGLFVKDRFDCKKENPAAKTERDNKVLFARLIRELGLDLEDPPESRPPRQY